MSQNPDPTQPAVTNTNPPAPQQAPKQGAGLAIAALIIGILAFMLSIIPLLNVLAIPPAVVGLVLGLIGLIGAIKGTRAGKGIAIAGVVLNALVFIVFFAMYSPSSDSSDTTKDSAVTSSESTADADKATDDSDAATESDDAAKEAEEQDNSALAVGSVAKLDNGLEVTVNATEPVTDMVGDNYLLVSVTYTNNGSDKVEAASYDWKSVNGSGVETDSTWPLLDDDSELIPVLGASLNSGGTLSGKVALAQDAVSVHFYGNMFDEEPTATWNLQ